MPESVVRSPSPSRPVPRHAACALRIMIVSWGLFAPQRGGWIAGREAFLEPLVQLGLQAACAGGAPREQTGEVLDITAYGGLRLGRGQDDLHRRLSDEARRAQP